MQDTDDGPNGIAGAAVDSRGRAVLDPTKNVLDLVDAAIKRQDDLREMADEHAREMADLRAEYDDKLREAESKRIDAIRAVDVGQVQRAAEVQTDAANALAGQVIAQAEALRAQVAATATAAATSLGAALVPVQEAIAELREAQYKAAGQKVQVSETQEATAGGRQSIGLWIAAAGLGISFFFSAAAVIITLLLKG